MLEIDARLQGRNAKHIVRARSWCSNAKKQRASRANEESYKDDADAKRRGVPIRINVPVSSGKTMRQGFEQY